MKDSVVRGRVLQLLHERRGEGFLPFGAAERAVPTPEGINNRDWLQALAQLAEYNLIDWKPIEDKSGMGLLGGCNQTLFSDSDPYSRSRINRYWDGDSATQTTESRRRASEMGFGFPTGMANQ